MKKLLLLLTLFAGTLVQAQDFGIVLVEPASGGRINSGVATTFKLFVKNNTAATMPSGTSYGIGFGTRTAAGAYQAFNNNVLPRTLAADLAAGDSVEISVDFTLTLSPGTNVNSFVCVAVYKVSGTTATFQIASCRVYNLFNSVSEIELAASTVKVYPNPVSDVLHITIEYNKASKNGK
ncbi:MAG: hypothetical protein MUC81_11385 [Bacteroidia bacterium]|nr:hypothetical protein [Bacteroidia bacterium]